MTWLKDAISDSRGHASSTRVTTLAAGLTLSFCTLLLTAGSFWRIELVPALTVFGTALAGLAGANSVAHRWATKDGKNESGA